jgi:hypothetical protein
MEESYIIRFCNNSVPAMLMRGKSAPDDYNRGTKRLGCCGRASRFDLLCPDI